MNKLNSSVLTHSLAERLWPYFGWLVFLFFTTFLVFDRVVYALLALFLVVIACVIAYAYRLQWDKELRVLAWVLVANLLLALPNIVLGRDGLISLENPVRMLMMLPLILAVMYSGLRIRFISVGLAVGMLVAALVVGWQYYFLGEDRPGIHYNPLLFSEVAMSAFAVLLAASLVYRDRLAPLYIVGLLAAFFCVIISGSRGTLIAIVPMAFYLMWWGWRRGAVNRVFSSRRFLWISAIMLILSGLLISSGSFMERIHLAAKQTTDYMENANTETSISLRLELWRGALMAGRDHPLLGIGFRERHTYLNQKIADGELKPYVANSRHAHNDYLDALQSRGVPGLILQLLIYGVPILIFMRGLAEARDEKLFAALAGMLVTISYATYSLTEVPMHNGQPLVFYIVIISLCIGIIKHTKSAVSADNPRKSG
ncbi:MAG: O-antigen ligase family protein [Proteobacteria bacterium]|nr:O-antigen ligase family protein [Pseudomonadota bacterium]